MSFLNKFKKRFAYHEWLFFSFYIKSLAPKILLQSDTKEGARKNLAFWFALERKVRSQINRHSVAFYEGKHPKHSRWVNHNKYIIENVKEGEKVIDIGCGASEYTQWLADKAKHVTGVDILPERIDAMKKKNTKANVSYEVMDVTKDLPADTFDVAVCSHVLEHLDDPIHFLSKLSEKVPRIIIKVPFDDTDWFKIVQRDIGIFWMDDEDHRREYTEEMMKEQLDNSGWMIKEIIRGYDLRCVALSKKLNG